MAKRELKCCDCQELKAEDSYHKDASTSRGLSYRCKDCIKVHAKRMHYQNHAKNLLRAKKYRIENSETISKKLKAFRGKLGKEELSRRRFKYMKDYKERNPLKTKARMIYDHAVSQKKLIKSPCKFCKATKVEGHHTDYNEPLNVIWLCKDHHAAWHRVFEAEQDFNF